MRGELVSSKRYPRVPMGRRVTAFCVDFGIASLLSSFGGGNLYIFLFALGWLGLRVIAVEKNKGQSLGKWVFDIRVADFRFGATPGLTELLKREAITGLGCLLVLISIVNLSPTSSMILVGPIPLLIDCGLAFFDPDNRQAFHDRIARTVVAQTRQGYSLDIKLKKMFAQRRRRMK